MADWVVRPFEGRDFEPVVSLLERSLAADAVTPALFTRRVLLDPNFEPEGAPVACANGEAVGFMLSIARRRPLEDGADDSDRGWITLFAVEEESRGRGIGGALLEHALEWLRARGRASVHVSPYAPNYWAPGVDMLAYPQAVSFLEKQGFATTSRPISMDTRLVGGWRIPDWLLERERTLCASGLAVHSYAPEHAPALAQFLRAHFPGDWQRYVRESLLDITAGRRALDDVIIAYDGHRVVGFSHHEGERFGPFGVAASDRGRGIGAVLLFRTLEIMRRRGHHNAWFLWTDDATADRVYRAAGFAESRRFAVMSRTLESR
jgi:GNAT superfamily N-acetyltransferase